MCVCARTCCMHGIYMAVPSNLPRLQLAADALPWFQCTRRNWGVMSCDMVSIGFLYSKI